MSKGGKRAVRIPTTLLLLGGEKLGEVIAGTFPFPVVGQQPDSEPGDDVGSRSLERILDFPRFVGTHRFDAYPVPYVRASKPSNASAHLFLMPARIAMPARFLVSSEMRPPGRTAPASASTQSVNDGRYIATP